MQWEEGFFECLATQIANTIEQRPFWSRCERRACLSYRYQLITPWGYSRNHLPVLSFSSFSSFSPLPFSHLKK
ncbi:hypothetical protein Q7C36_006809 [Tachysurus vachellii]|uniref:Uncharacterized protein n=1 Tax=Tachysurus vachellii TaxID=175792 RepID=A0AA88NDH8_TACVA|nr:hypothetical protein Q7C36_006809 [Tachysurus vachellii]